MKLTRIPCEGVQKAKKLLLTKKYYIALSGQRVTFMNHSFEIVKVLEKFTHSYNGSISPDGKYLLVISNSPMFYLISLETLELIDKVRIKGGVETIEGRGCWSPDGQHIVIPLKEEKYWTYSVRLYNVNKPKSYTDIGFPARAFHIYDIASVVEHNAYYLLVKNRRDGWTDLPSTAMCLIKYIENRREIIEIKDQREIPFSFEYNRHTDRFTVCTLKKPFTCSPDGGDASVIDVDGETVVAGFPYIVKQVTVSKNGKWVFMASTSGFDIFDKKTGEVLLYKEYEFGATHITEIEENLIAVAFCHGSMRLFKIEE